MTAFMSMDRPSPCLADSKDHATTSVGTAEERAGKKVVLQTESHVAPDEERSRSIDGEECQAHAIRGSRPAVVWEIGRGGIQTAVVRVIAETLATEHLVEFGLGSEKEIEQIGALGIVTQTKGRAGRNIGLPDVGGTRTERVVEGLARHYYRHTRTFCCGTARKCKWRTRVVLPEPSAAAPVIGRVLNVCTVTVLARLPRCTLEHQSVRTAQAHRKHTHKTRKKGDTCGKRGQAIIVLARSTVSCVGCISTEATNGATIHTKMHATIWRVTNMAFC